MKAIFLEIKFDPKWILANQSSGRSGVTEAVIGAITDKAVDGAVFTIKKEFHMCRLVVAVNGPFTKDETVALVKSAVNGIDESSFSVAFEELEAERVGEMLEPISERLNVGERALLEREFGINPVKKEESGKEKGTDASAHVDAETLIGMDGLKAWVNEIKGISEKFGGVARDTAVFKNLSYLISINRGNGLTTVLSIMADALKKSGLVEFSGKCDYIEWKLDYSENPNEFDSFGRFLQRIERVGSEFKGLVAFDVSEWLDHLGEKRFDILLRYVWENRGDMVFVFTVPFVERSVLDKLYDRIEDIISVRVMKFPPFSDEEYFRFFVSQLSKYGISVSDDAYSSFVLKITSEKNDGKFYGFNTVKKIVSEMLYSIIAEASKNSNEIPKTIYGADLDRIYELKEQDGISGIEQLNGMVALEAVKSKVQEILSAVKLQRELFSHGASKTRPCFHMMFTGNPGTGKTVVARIVGRIFKEEGLLSVGNFYEVSRKDFIGKFVGHTAPKTMEICRNAYGSVLFIDEAYMLADDRDGFSSEAIGTLIAEMENNRDKMVVIFAGYEKELESLFDMNPGLRDRIPYKIDFPNYNREELKKIFYLQLNSKVKHDESFDRRADEFFDGFPEDVLARRDFSNGRFVRNLAERIMSKAALRFEMSGSDFEEFRLTEGDFSVAVADSDFSKLFVKVKSTPRIGFN